MIELTRVRLINWHNFQDVCIPFRMVTYMIGVNAVGKTTIMDAIRYCITTKKEFNTAGNRLSVRTLQGSVHGKQRESGRYSRPGHTVSYVGVEFLDRERKANFVIVVRVESESPEQELRHVSQEWFITPLGTRLEELKFLDRENRPTKRETFKSSCRGLRAPKTQADTRRQICRVLGIGDADSSIGKKFNEVFHMGTSLKDIEDIGDFIRAYILPEPEIRVDELQSDMRELERLGETLAEAQNRETILREIVASGRQAEKLQKDVLVNSGFILLAVSRKFSAQEETYQRRSEAANDELERLRPMQEEAEEKLRRAVEKLSEARRDRDEDPDYQATAFYREKETELAQEYRRQVRRRGEWEQSLEKLSGLLDVSRLAGSATCIELDPKQYYDWDKVRRESAVKALPSQIDALYSELDGKDFLIRTEKGQLDREKDQKSAELQSLSQGNMVFPQTAVTLCEKINSELSSRGMTPDATILAMLLTMTDESWQECAEAALGQRRFDILVPPEHYRAAKAAFTALGGTSPLWIRRALSGTAAPLRRPRPGAWRKSSVRRTTTQGCM